MEKAIQQDNLLPCYCKTRAAVSLMNHVTLLAICLHTPLCRMLFKSYVSTTKTAKYSKSGSLQTKINVKMMHRATHCVPMSHCAQLPSSYSFLFSALPLKLIEFLCIAFQMAEMRRSWLCNLLKYDDPPLLWCSLPEATISQVNGCCCLCSLPCL